MHLYIRKMILIVLENISDFIYLCEYNDNKIIKLF